MARLAWIFSRSPVWFKQALGDRAVNFKDPCIEPKSIKTRAEQEALRAAHIRDGVALVNFLYWLDMNDAEITEIVGRSRIAKRYNEEIDSESAHEMLTEKLKEAAAITKEEAAKGSKPEKSTIEKMADNTIVKSMLRTAGNAIVRSILGNLGLGGSSRRKR